MTKDTFKSPDETSETIKVHTDEDESLNKHIADVVGGENLTVVKLPDQEETVTTNRENTTDKIEPKSPVVRNSNFVYYIYIYIYIYFVRTY